MAKKTELQKLKTKLEKVCHDYIRARDSWDKGLAKTGYYNGFCFDCGKYIQSQHFQAGHFHPSGSSGAILRYHPHNIHGQASGCNMAFQQERVKINYTLAMINKYGKNYVEKLGQLKQKTIKADCIFYQTMIDLYTEGNEKKIIKYLESL